MQYFPATCRTAGLVLAAALLPAAAQAAAIKVYSPEVEQGETEIEYQGLPHLRQRQHEGQ